MLLTVKARRALARLHQVKANELLTFEPSPVFRGLPDLAQQHTKILIRAANRVGKTRHSAWVAAKYMVENPGARVRVIGPTNKHAQTVLGKYLAEFLKPYLASGSYYVDGKGWNGGRAKTVILRNGSVLELLSLEDKVDAHSGASCHLIVFDEPPSLAHFTENMARLADTMGTVIVAATMVNRPVGWLREMVQGEDGDAPAGVTKHASGWLQVVAVYSLDNCPWYTQEQANEWLATMELTPWERGQRVDAAWDGVTAQRVLMGIKDGNFTHDSPPGSTSIGLGIDHGDLAGHQTCVLVAFKGTAIWVIDEYRSSTSTTPEEDAKAINAMLKRHGMTPRSVDLAVGDIGHVRGFTGYKINEAMMSAFGSIVGGPAPFRIQTPDKTPGSVDWGLRCMNYAGIRGDLRIHPRCLNVTQGVRHWKGGRKGTDGDLSHTLDALRYILATAIGHHKQYARLRFT